MSFKIPNGLFSKPDSESNIFSKKGGRKFRRLGHELNVSLKPDVEISKSKRRHEAKRRALHKAKN